MINQPKKRFSPDHIVNSICESKYDPREGVTFVVYVRRFEPIFDNKSQVWMDKMKMYLVLRELSTAEHEKYSHFILSKKYSRYKYYRCRRYFVQNV